MGVDWSNQVLLPNYDYFARPITVTPLASQPGAPAYAARGIYDSDAAYYFGLDNAVLSDQVTYIDLREIEFGVVPRQGDLINIPADPDAPGMPALGDFEIIDTGTNGGGETTATLRKWETAAP